MDQHYIPRAYLGGFCDPATPAGQEPWLWVCDLAEGSTKRRAPKNVAKKANYYSVKRGDEHFDHAALAMEILRMRWQFVITAGPEHIVTGDVPVTWRNPHGPAGLRMRGTRLSFPVSSHICLVGTHTEPEGVHDITAEEGRDLNRERVRHADRHIFAASEQGVQAALEVYRALCAAGDAHASLSRLAIIEEGRLRDVTTEIAADREPGR